MGMGINSQDENGMYNFSGRSNWQKTGQVILLYPLVGSFFPAEDDFCLRFCGECYLREL